MEFLNDDFLLTTETGKRLYHGIAAEMPIYDYHCHIDPKDIYEDRRFSDIAELWLSGDHYKWRIMRSNGVAERYITGDAPPREKFQKFAEALERCIGNPMYHWCHLELKNYFGYEGVLNGGTAQEVWDITCEKLRGGAFSARRLIEGSNVYMVGTTDDPCSDLMYHRRLKDSDFSVKVCPTFRPDSILNLHKPGFAEYIESLGKVCCKKITSIDDIKSAITDRLEYFVSCGCKASDHGLDRIIFRISERDALQKSLDKALSGVALSNAEIEGYQTELLLYCAREYARLGLVMQIHFSCMRNPNSAKLACLGIDTGFDSMAVTDSCAALYRFTDTLESEGCLPKTVLYSLNPSDNAWLDSLIGAFPGEGIRGKLQHGSAWWFNDHKAGMVSQLTSLASIGTLGNFIGMLTDSRSFLSYARHEYFRRILCDLIGTWIENGEYPADYDTLRVLIEGICFNNAKRYFGE